MAKNASYDSLIQDSARRHGVNPALMKAVMKQESHFNPNARSPVGAQGLMQLMPATARRFGVSDSFNPAQNIEGGAKYLAYLNKMFRGDLTKVIAAYNAGEGNVKKHGGVPPFRETQDYVRKVTANYANFSGGGQATAPSFRSPQNSFPTQTAKNKYGFTVTLAPIKTRSGRSVLVSAKYAHQFQGFINELEDSGYPIKVIGGYADRANVNSPKNPSKHSLGLAIDINPDSNPNFKGVSREERAKNPRKYTDMNVPMVSQIAKKWGVGWGYEWNTISDAMHFSVAPNENGRYLPNIGGGQPLFEHDFRPQPIAQNWQAFIKSQQPVAPKPVAKNWAEFVKSQPPQQTLQQPEQPFTPKPIATSWEQLTGVNSQPPMQATQDMSPQTAQQPTISQPPIAPQPIATSWDELIKNQG